MAVKDLGQGLAPVSEQCGGRCSDEAQSPHAQARVLPTSKALLLLEGS